MALCSLCKMGKVSGRGRTCKICSGVEKPDFTSVCCECGVVPSDICLPSGYICVECYAGVQDEIYA